MSVLQVEPFPIPRTSYENEIVGELIILPEPRSELADTAASGDAVQVLDQNASENGPVTYAPRKRKGIVAGSVGTALIKALEREPDENPLAWQEKSLCAQTDPEIFFPEKGGSNKPAKLICAMCEVRVECLSDSLTRDDRYGIAGGLSERERQRLKRGLKSQPAS